MNNTTQHLSGLIEKLDDVFVGLGMGEGLTHFTRTIIVLLVIIGLAVLADWISKKVLISGVQRLASRTKSQLDDILVKRRVFHRIAHVIPALIIFGTADFVFKDYLVLDEIVERAALVYIVLMVLLAIDSLINALHEIYLTLPISEGRTIKGYVQVVKIIFYFIAIILIISIIIRESPTRLLTGLGAIAAVLLLVFKDTILGFVASIQLSANKMVQPGDWISMPSHGADGDVFDISLNTVKVQNFDKTIITIPTYALVSESFQNWRGMEESGGRRIKRSINIDMNSVKFLDEEMLRKFKKIQRLQGYIDKKQAELDKYNEEHGIDNSVLVNGRRMTNLGTFRAYIEQYLRNHPKINQDLTFLIRHLQPTDKGLPIEIYVFSNDKVWANYEAIQADIFDHILAVIPEFGLRVFQNPTGADFQKLSS